MTQDQIKELLRLHQLWIIGDNEGICADLYGADLRGADLRDANLRDAGLYGADLRDADLYGADLRGANLYGADLYGCTGNGREIITTQTDGWTVTRTATVMQIGCQNHTIEEWASFNDDAVGSMDAGALKWWKVWKPIIFAMIDAAPAKETGHE